MSNFSWNINFLLFWRLAWLRDNNHIQTASNWGHIGRLYYATQWRPFAYAYRYWFDHI